MPNGLVSKFYHPSRSLIIDANLTHVPIRCSIRELPAPLCLRTRRVSAQSCKRLSPATKSHNTRCCRGRLRPHDGRDNRNRSQRRLEQTLASLRDASPAWSGQPPLGAALPFIILKIVGIGLPDLSGNLLNFFRLGVAEPCTTPFGEAAIAAFSAHQVISCRPPGARSG